MKRIGMQEAEVLPDRNRLTVSSELRGLVRDLPMAAAVLDAEGHAWIWNAAAEQMFPPPPQISQVRYPLFSLAGQPWFATVRAAALQGRASKDLPWRLRGLGGTHYRIGVSLTPVRAENGGVSALLAVLQDTTIRDRAYRRSVQRARRNVAVLDHLPDPVLVHRGGRIVYANRPALRLFGASTKRQLIGRELDACVMPLPNGLASLLRA